MAPADLLQPLEGQREETLRILEGLENSQLEFVHRDSGWTVTQIFAHIASVEQAEAFVIRSSAEGDSIHISEEDRDLFDDQRAIDCTGWDRARIRSELRQSRDALRDSFAHLEEQDLDHPIRWPEWAARSIRSSIPYMLEHEDSHLDQVRDALGIRV
jgi:hypothetical protein